MYEICAMFHFILLRINYGIYIETSLDCLRFIFNYRIIAGGSFCVQFPVDNAIAAESMGIVFGLYPIFHTDVISFQCIIVLSMKYFVQKDFLRLNKVCAGRCWTYLRKYVPKTIKFQFSAFGSNFHSLVFILMLRRTSMRLRRAVCNLLYFAMLFISATNHTLTCSATARVNKDTWYFP